MTLPNFVIAGATRSGTTSLYHYLKQHPQIGFPDLKEPRYFSSIHLKLPQAGPGDNTVDEKLITDIRSYEKLYKNLSNYKRIGDASSEYLYHYEVTADEILKILGDIPVLIILRNPIERAYSAYSNHVRDGREKEAFEKALRLENDRINSNWDMMWAYKGVGLYYKQVKRYLDVFSNVHIIIFEEFIEKTDEMLKEVFRFLGLEENISVDTSTNYSHSGNPKNKIVGWFTSRNNKYVYPVRKAIINTVPRSLLERVAKKMYNKSEIKEETRMYLRGFYREDIRQLEKLISKDLSHWK